MSETFKLSREQEQAVDITKNIAVSAGAGSGKTRVLTTRYLKLLEDGVEISEIAAITFTEKAALEMKQRIRRAVIDRISREEGNEKLKWMSHLDRISRANISTIHGFCSTIVKENAAFLGIDFNSGIISEIDRAVILREAAEAARVKAFEKDEYRDVITSLSRVYGEKYMKADFMGEIHIIREELKDIGEDSSILYDRAAASSLERLIFELVLETEKYYRDYKSSRELLDFSDLELLALRVLEIKKFRDRYKERYRTLLVDEFQDTNEVQRSIIYHLAAEEDGNLSPAKLFIVGDLKQSIYGFRGTDYKIFKRVSEDIGKEGQVSLSTCYRSEKEIIEGINSIFTGLIKDYEPLRCPKDRKVEEPRIKVITSKKEKVDKKDKKTTLGEIKNYLQGKESDVQNLETALEELKDSIETVTPKENKGGLTTIKAIQLLRDKDIDFRDICILVRSKSAIPEIEEELKKRRVPYCIIGGRGFYQRPEVDEVLNLYRVIIRGFEGEFTYEDNISFIKALRSPFLEVTDNVILSITIEREEGKRQNLYEAMEYVIDGMKDEEKREALRQIHNNLGKLNRLRDRLSVLQILGAILEEFKVYETILTQEDGVQGFRNIEKLMYEAECFDKQNLFTLEQFLEYMEELNKNSTGDAEAALDTEDAEAIKIMTIHQSKGLEFKGVIIPRIQGDLLSVSQRGASKIIYNNRGLLLEKDINTGEKTVEYREFMDNKLNHEIDEYIRLLYVAMTRAEKYVILTGEDNGEDVEEGEDIKSRLKNLNSFLKQLKYAFDIKGAERSLIEFLNPEDINDLSVFEGRDNGLIGDKLNIEKQVGFVSRVKPSSRISATRYMHYEKCPRKFYIEGVLRVKGSEYLEKELDEELPVYEGVSAAEFGTAVHSALEALNEGLNEEEALERASVILKGKSLGRVKRHVKGYNKLEGERGEFRLIKTFSEVEYNLSPLEDKNLSLQGFIDRLEVVEREGRLIGVITDYKTNRIDSEERKQSLVETYKLQLQIYGKAIMDLLYEEGKRVEEVILQLYFLDIPEKVELAYEEAKAMDMMRKMDEVFSRNLSRLSSEDFPKKITGNCQKCEYRSICLE